MMYTALVFIGAIIFAEGASYDQLFFPQGPQQCPSLQFVQFHGLLQELIADMPLSIVGNKNTFAAYIEQKVQELGNSIGSVDSSLPILPPNNAAVGELQSLVEEYLTNPSPQLLQRIAVLSVVYQRDTVPVRIRTLLQTNGLLSTEAALLGFIDFYPQVPSPQLLSAIAELHSRFPSVQIPDDILNELIQQGLIFSAPLQSPTGVPSLPPSPSREVLLLQRLIEQALSTTSTTVLQQIFTLSRTCRDVPIPNTILEQIRLMQLIEMFRMTPTLTIAEKILQLLVSYPNFPGSSEVTPLISIIQQLEIIIVEYLKSPADPILIKIIELSKLVPSYALPAPIPEHISKFHARSTYEEYQRVSVEEVLLQSLIQQYLFQSSTALLSQIAELSALAPNVVIPDPLAADLADYLRLLKLSPNEILLKQLLNEYQATGSAIVLENIRQLLSQDPSLQVPNNVAQSLIVLSTELNAIENQLSQSIQQFIIDPSLETLKIIAELSPLAPNVPIPQLISQILYGSEQSLNEAALNQLIHNYYNDPTLENAYKIAQLIADDPTLAVPSSIAQLISLLGADNQSDIILLEQYVHQYLQSSSLKVLIEIDRLHRLLPDVVLPVIIIEALNQLHSEQLTLLNQLTSEFTATNSQIVLEEIISIVDIIGTVDLDPSISSAISDHQSTLSSLSIYEQKVQNLWYDYTSSSLKDPSILSQIAHILSAHPEIIVANEIIQEIENQSYNNRVVQVLIQEYEETHSVSTLIEIREIVNTDPSVNIPEDIAHLISNLPSYAQILVDNLIHEYQITQSIDIIISIAHVIDNSPDVIIPIYIAELISRLNQPQLSLPEILLRSLISNYEVSHSLAILQEIGILIANDPHLSVPAFILRDFPLISLTSPRQVLITELIQKYEISKSVDILSVIQQVVVVYKDVFIPSFIGQQLTLLPDLSFSFTLQTLLQALVQLHENSPSATILAVIVDIIRDNPMLYLPYSFIQTIYPYIGEQDSSSLTQIQQLITQYEESSSVEILEQISQVIDADPSVRIPSSITQAIVNNSPVLGPIQIQLQQLVDSYSESQDSSILNSISQLLEDPKLLIPGTVAVKLAQTVSNQAATQSLQNLFNEYEASPNVQVLNEIQGMISEDPNLTIPAYIAQGLAELPLLTQTEQRLQELTEIYLNTNNEAVLEQIAEIAQKNPYINIPQSIAASVAGISASVRLEQDIKTYSESQTIENLVPILNDLEDDPQLTVPGYIARQLATISYLNDDELKLKILIEKYQRESNDVLLEEISALSAICPNIPIPSAIAQLLPQDPNRFIPSFLSNQIRLEKLISEYYADPSQSILMHIAELIALDPQLPVPPYIARLLAQREAWLNSPEARMEHLITEYQSTSSHVTLLEIAALSAKYPYIYLPDPIRTLVAGLTATSPFLPDTSSVSIAKLKQLIQLYLSSPTDDLLSSILELCDIFPDYPLPETIIIQKLVQIYMKTQSITILQQLVALLPNNLGIVLPEPIIVALLLQQLIPNDPLRDVPLLLYLANNYAYTESLTILQTIAEIYLRFPTTVLPQSIIDRLTRLGYIGETTNLTIADLERLIHLYEQSPSDALLERIFQTAVHFPDYIISDRILLNYLIYIYSKLQTVDILKQIGVKLLRVENFEISESLMIELLENRCVFGRADDELILLKYLLRYFPETESLAILKAIATIHANNPQVNLPITIIKRLLKFRIWTTFNEEELENVFNEFLDLTSLSSPTAEIRMKTLPLFQTTLDKYVIFNIDRINKINDVVQDLERRAINTESYKVIKSLLDTIVALISSLVAESSKRAAINRQIIESSAVNNYEMTASEEQTLLENFQLVSKLLGRAVGAVEALASALKSDIFNPIIFGNIIIDIASDSSIIEALFEELLHLLDTTGKFGTEPEFKLAGSSQWLVTEEFATILSIILPVDQKLLESHIPYIKKWVTEIKFLIDGITQGLIDSPVPSYRNFLSILNGILNYIVSLGNEFESLVAANRDFINKAASTNFILPFVEYRAYNERRTAAFTIGAKSEGVVKAISNAANMGILNVGALASIIHELMIIQSSIPSIDPIFDDLSSYLSFKDVSRQEILATILPPHIEHVSQDLNIKVAQLQMLEPLVTSVVSDIRKTGTPANLQLAEVIQQTYALIVSLVEEAKVSLKANTEILAIFASKHFDISDQELQIFTQNHLTTKTALARADAALLALINSYSDSKLTISNSISILSELLQSLKFAKSIESTFDDVQQLISFPVGADVPSNVFLTSDFPALLRIYLPSVQALCDKHVQYAISRLVDVKTLALNILSGTANTGLPSYQAIASLINAIVASINYFVNEGVVLADENRQFFEYISIKEFAIKPSDLQQYLDNIKLIAIALGRAAGATEALALATTSGGLNVAALGKLLHTLIEMDDSLLFVEQIFYNLQPILSLEHVPKQNILEVTLPILLKATEQIASIYREKIFELNYLMEDIILGMSNTDMQSVEKLQGDLRSIQQVIKALSEKTNELIENCRRLLSITSARNFDATQQELNSFLNDLKAANSNIGRAAGAAEAVVIAYRKGDLSVATIQKILTILLKLDFELNSVESLFNDLQDMGPINDKARQIILSTTLPPRQARIEKLTQRNNERVASLQPFLKSIITPISQSSIQSEKNLADLLQRILNLIITFSNEVNERMLSNREIVSFAASRNYEISEKQLVPLYENTKSWNTFLGKADGATTAVINAYLSGDLNVKTLGGIISYLLEVTTTYFSVENLYDELMSLLALYPTPVLGVGQIPSSGWDVIAPETTPSSLSEYFLVYDLPTLLRIILPTRQAELQKLTVISVDRYEEVKILVQQLITSSANSNLPSYQGIVTLLNGILSLIGYYNTEATMRVNANQEILQFIGSQDYKVMPEELIPYLENIQVAHVALGRAAGATEALSIATSNGSLNFSALGALLRALLEMDESILAVDIVFDGLQPLLNIEHLARENILELTLPVWLEVVELESLRQQERLNELIILIDDIILKSASTQFSSYLNLGALLRGIRDYVIKLVNEGTTRVSAARNIVQQVAVKNFDASDDELRLFYSSLKESFTIFGRVTGIIEVIVNTYSSGGFSIASLTNIFKVWLLIDKSVASIESLLDFWPKEDIIGPSWSIIASRLLTSKVNALEKITRVSVERLSAFNAFVLSIVDQFGQSSRLDEQNLVKLLQSILQLVTVLVNEAVDKLRELHEITTFSSTSVFDEALFNACKENIRFIAVALGKAEGAIQALVDIYLRGDLAIASAQSLLNQLLETLFESNIVDDIFDQVISVLDLSDIYSTTTSINLGSGSDWIVDEKYSVVLNSILPLQQKVINKAIIYQKKLLNELESLIQVLTGGKSVYEIPSYEKFIILLRAVIHLIRSLTEEAEKRVTINNEIFNKIIGSNFNVAYSEIYTFNENTKYIAALLGKTFGATKEIVDAANRGSLNIGVLASYLRTLFEICASVPQIGPIYDLVSDLGDFENISDGYLVGNILTLKNDIANKNLVLRKAQIEALRPLVQNIITEGKKIGLKSSLRLVEVIEKTFALVIALFEEGSKYIDANNHLLSMYANKIYDISLQEIKTINNNHNLGVSALSRCEGTIKALAEAYTAGALSINNAAAILSQLLQTFKLQKSIESTYDEVLQIINLDIISDGSSDVFVTTDFPALLRTTLPAIQAVCDKHVQYTVSRLVDVKILAHNLLDSSSEAGLPSYQGIASLINGIVALINYYTAEGSVRADANRQFLQYVTSKQFIISQAELKPYLENIEIIATSLGRATGATQALALAISAGDLNVINLTKLLRELIQIDENILFIESIFYDLEPLFKNDHIARQNILEQTLPAIQQITEQTFFIYRERFLELRVLMDVVIQNAADTKMPSYLALSTLVNNIIHTITSLVDESQVLLKETNELLSVIAFNNFDATEQQLTRYFSDMKAITVYMGRATGAAEALVEAFNSGKLTITAIAKILKLILQLDVALQTVENLFDSVQNLGPIAAPARSYILSVLLPKNQARLEKLTLINNERVVSLQLFLQSIITPLKESELPSELQLASVLERAYALIKSFSNEANERMLSNREVISFASSKNFDISDKQLIPLFDNTKAWNIALGRAEGATTAIVNAYLSGNLNTQTLGGIISYLLEVTTSYSSVEGLYDELFSLLTLYPTPVLGVGQIPSSGWDVIAPETTPSSLSEYFLVYDLPTLLRIILPTRQAELQKLTVISVDRYEEVKILVQQLITSSANSNLPSYQGIVTLLNGVLSLIGYYTTEATMRVNANQEILQFIVSQDYKVMPEELIPYLENIQVAHVALGRAAGATEALSIATSNGSLNFSALGALLRALLEMDESILAVDIVFDGLQPLLNIEHLARENILELTLPVWLEVVELESLRQQERLNELIILIDDIILKSASTQFSSYLNLGALLRGIRDYVIKLVNEGTTRVSAARKIVQQVAVKNFDASDDELRLFYSTLRESFTIFGRVTGVIDAIAITYNNGDLSATVLSKLLKQLLLIEKDIFAVESIYGKWPIYDVNDISRPYILSHVLPLRQLAMQDLAKTLSNRLKELTSFISSIINQLNQTTSVPQKNLADLLYRILTVIASLTEEFIEYTNKNNEIIRMAQSVKFDISLEQIEIINKNHVIGDGLAGKIDGATMALINSLSNGINVSVLSSALIEILSIFKEIQNVEIIYDAIFALIDDSYINFPLDRSELIGYEKIPTDPTIAKDIAFFLSKTLPLRQEIFNKLIDENNSNLLVLTDLINGVVAGTTRPVSRSFAEMTSLLKAIIDLLQKLTSQSVVMRNENQNFLDYARSQNFLIPTKALVPYITNEHKAAILLGRSKGVVVALTDAARRGSLNIGLLNIILRTLLQINWTFPDFTDSNKLLNIPILEDSPRVVLQTILPLRLSELEKNVYVNNERVENMKVIFSSIFEQFSDTSSVAQNALRSILQVVSNLIISLSKEAEKLLDANKRILSSFQNSEEISETVVKNFLSNEEKAYIAVGKANGGMMVVVNAYTKGDLSVGIGNVLTQFLEYLDVNFAVESVYSQLLTLLDVSDKFISDTQIDLSSDSHWEVNDDYSIILSIILTSQQSILEKQLQININYVQEITKLVQVVTQSGTEVVSYQKYKSILITLVELIATLTQDAEGKVIFCRNFIQNASLKHFGISYSDVIAYNRNARAAFVALGKSSGAVGGLINAANAGLLNIGVLARFLGLLLQINSELTSIDTTFDELNSVLFEDLILSQTVLSDLLPSLQSTIENAVKLNKIQVTSLVALIRNIVSSLRTTKMASNGKLADVLEQILELISVWSQEAEERTLTSREILKVFASQNFEIPIEKLNPFKENIKAIRVALGRSSGATIALIDAYNNGDLAISNVRVILNKLTDYFRIEKEIESTYNDIFQLVNTEYSQESGIQLFETIDFPVLLKIILPTRQALLEKHTAIIQRQFTEVKLLIDDLIEKVRYSSLSSYKGISDLLKGIFSLLEHYVTEAITKSKQNKEILTYVQSKNYIVSSSELKPYLENMNAAKLVLGKAMGIIEALVAAVNAGSLNLSSITIIIKDIIKVDSSLSSIEILFDDILSLTHFDDRVARRNILSQLLPNRITVLIELLNTINEQVAVVRSIVEEIYGRAVVANTPSSQVVVFELEAISTLITKLIDRAIVLLTENKNLVLHFTAQSFDVSDTDLKLFKENDQVLYRILGKAHGTCEAVIAASKSGSLSNFALGKLLRELELIVSEENLLYELKELFAGETLLQQLIDRYMSVRTFSVLKEISRLMVIYTRVEVPGVIIKELYRLGLYNGAKLTQEYVLLQTIEEYLENAHMNLLEKIMELLPLYPDTLIPDPILEQLILKQFFVKSETYLKQLISFYSVRSTREVIIVIGLAIENFPQYPLPLTIIEQLLRLGVTSEVILVQLIREFISSSSITVLHWISDVHTHYHPNHQLPIPILDALLANGLLVKTKIYYLYLIQQYSTKSTNLLIIQFIGELIELFPDVTVPSSILQQLIAQKIISKTIYHHVVLAFMSSQSHELLIIIAQLRTIFPDYVLPPEILALLADLSVDPLIIETKEEHLIHLIEEYQSSNSLSLLSEISELHSTLPDVDITKSILDQIVLYDDIQQVTTSAAADVSVFSQINELSPLYPQIPLPSLIEEEIYFYQLIQKAKSGATVEIILEIARLAPSFPNIPIPTEVEQQIYLLQLIEVVKGGDSSTVVLQYIGYLSSLYPLIPIPNSIQDQILLVHLIAEVQQSSSPSSSILQQIAALSAIHVNIPIPADIQEQILLLNLIEEVMSSSSPSLAILQQIAILARSFPHITIPSAILQQITLIELIQKVIKTPSPEPSLLLKIFDLSQQFQHIPIPVAISQQIILLQLIQKGDIIPYDDLLQISSLSKVFPNIPLSSHIQQQVVLVDLLIELSEASSPSLSSLQQVALLSQTYKHIIIPKNIEQQILLVQLLDEVDRADIPNISTLQQIGVLSSSITNIPIPDSIREQIRLLSLLEKYAESTSISVSIIQEISQLSALYLYIPVSTTIAEQVRLFLAIQQASQQESIAISLLEEISTLSLAYPHIPVPNNVREPITLINLIAEVQKAQIASFASLTQINDISAKYSYIPIPNLVQQQILLSQLLEHFDPLTVTTEITKQIATLTQTVTNIAVSDIVKNAIKLVQTIQQVVSSQSIDLTLFWLINDLSPNFPLIPVPIAIQEQIRLLILIKEIEESTVFSSTLIIEIIELSSKYPNIPIPLKIQHLIQLYTLVEETSHTTISSKNLNNLHVISDLSHELPFVPLPDPIQHEIHLYDLVNQVQSSESVSVDTVIEISNLAEEFPTFPMSQNILDSITLGQLLSQSDPSFSVIQQISDLSQTVTKIALPDPIQRQVTLVRDIDQLSHSSTHSADLLEDISSLSENFPNIPIPEDIMDEILLVHLMNEASSSSSVSVETVQQIADLVGNHPLVTIPDPVQHQIELVNLITLLETSEDPAQTLREISELSQTVSSVAISSEVKDQMLLVDLIDHALVDPSSSIISQIDSLSTAYPNIPIPDVIQIELHLQQLVDMYTSETNVEVLQEISTFLPLAPLFSIPENIQQQILLQDLIAEAMNSITVTGSVPFELLDSIDLLTQSFPTFPIPEYVIIALHSHHEIKYLLLLIEEAQATSDPDPTILQEIEELARLHPNVLIPESIQLLIMQHIQKMYFEQLVEELLTSPTPSSAVIEEIELLASTLNTIIPPEVQSIIQQFRLQTLLTQLITEAQESGAPSVTLLERIWEISQSLPGAILPQNIEDQILLLQLLKELNPSVEVLRKIQKISNSYPSISIPGNIQQQIVLLQLIDEALSKSDPSFAILEQISHSATLFPNIPIPDPIHKKIAYMKNQQRLEQLIKAVLDSPFPSITVLNEIANLAKIVTNVPIPPSISQQIRLQQLLEELQGSATPSVSTLNEIGKILLAVPNAPVPQAIRQQILLLQIIEEVQKSPSTARSKSNQIRQLAQTYPHIPIPQSVQKLLQRQSPHSNRGYQSTDPQSGPALNPSAAKLQQLITMYDRIPSPLILRQIAQLYPSAPDYPIPEKIMNSLTQLGYISPDSLPSAKLNKLINQYNNDPTDRLLQEIIQSSQSFPNVKLPTSIARAVSESKISSLLSNVDNLLASSPLNTATAAQKVEVEVAKRRQESLLDLTTLTDGYFDQAKNTLWALRDSVRASGHPMHRATLATFSNVLTSISALITQARGIASEISALLSKPNLSSSESAQLTARMRTANEILGKAEGARLALLIEAKEFSHLVKQSNDKVLVNANSLKMDIDKVIGALSTQTDNVVKRSAQ